MKILVKSSSKTFRNVRKSIKRQVPFDLWNLYCRNIFYLFLKQFTFFSYVAPRVWYPRNIRNIRSYQLELESHIPDASRNTSQTKAGFQFIRGDPGAVSPGARKNNRRDETLHESLQEHPCNFRDSGAWRLQGGFIPTPTTIFPKKKKD